jgi:hypothetical protein
MDPQKQVLDALKKQHIAERKQLIREHANQVKNLVNRQASEIRAVLDQNKLVPLPRFPLVERR